MPKSFKCWNCPAEYINDRSLRKHYEKFPDHRSLKQEVWQTLSENTFIYQ